MTKYLLDFVVHGSGDYVNERAGQALGLHKVVYRDVAGLWSLADADLAATMPVIGITMGAIANNRKGEILLQGYIGDNTWTWTAGQDLYASTVAGEITNIAPVAPDIVQIIAVAVSPTLIYFNSDLGSGGGGGAGDCAILEGHTAYVGFNACKSTHTNYFFCDGVADDVQINAAITYVNGLGGGSVFIEGGTYDITAALTVPSNISLMGVNDGRGATSTLLVQGANVNVLQAVGGYNPANLENITIRDITIDGDSRGHTGSGIYFKNVTQALIDNCYVVNFLEEGIHLVDETQDVIIEDTIIHTCGSSTFPAVNLDGSSGHIVIDIRLQNLQIEAPPWVGIQMDNYVQYVTCVGVKIHGSATTLWHADINGYRCDFIGCDFVAASTATYALFIKNAENKVTGCMFNDNGNATIAIYLDGAFTRQTIISDNTLIGALNTSEGIRLNGTSEVVIEGNQIQSFNYGIISVGASTHCVVNGNMISGGVGAGIRLANGHDFTITSNDIYNNAGSGITLLSDSDDNIIYSNKITGNTNYGINIQGATENDNRIGRNHLLGNTVGAINDVGTDTVTPEIFMPVTEPDGTIGTHPCVILTDNLDVSVYTQLAVPMEFQELVTAEVIIIPAGTGNMRREAFTNWGKMCSGEDYNAHTDTKVAGLVAVQVDDVECIDIAAAFTAIVAGDLVGIQFTRLGSVGTDSVNADCYYLGLRFRYV